MSYGFLHGTRIETGCGARLVQGLTPGDRVLSLAGKLETIRWVGHTTLSAREVARCPHLQPVVLKADGLVRDMPFADLVLAPEQGVISCPGAGQAATRGVPAGQLPHGTSRLPVLHDLYFTHLVLERPAFVLANGVWCESLQLSGKTAAAGYETQTRSARVGGRQIPG